MKISKKNYYWKKKAEKRISILSAFVEQKKKTHCKIAMRLLLNFQWKFQLMKNIRRLIFDAISIDFLQKTYRFIFAKKKKETSKMWWMKNNIGTNTTIYRHFFHFDENYIYVDKGIFQPNGFFWKKFAAIHTKKKSTKN